MLHIIISNSKIIEEGSNKTLLVNFLPPVLSSKIINLPIPVIIIIQLLGNMLYVTGNKGITIGCCILNKKNGYVE